MRKEEWRVEDVLSGGFDSITFMNEVMGEDVCLLVLFPELMASQSYKGVGLDLAPLY